MDKVQVPILSRDEIYKYLQNLSDEDRDQFMVLMKSFDKKLFYQLNPDIWAHDILKIPLEHLRWSLYPEYKLPGRGETLQRRVNDDGSMNPDGWDGTPDPLYAALRSLADWKETAIESATGTGKSFLAGIVILWFLANFKNSLVVIVAPKADQISNNVFKNIQETFWPKFKIEHPDAQLLDMEVRMHTDPVLKDSWKAFGFVASVRSGEESNSRASGIHAEHLLFIIDETQGVPNSIMEAIENTLSAPHNLRLALGNPNSITDPLHVLAERSDFANIRISGYDHPNIVCNVGITDDMPSDDVSNYLKYEAVTKIPGAVSWKSIVSRRNKYGPDPIDYNSHPLYKSRVRGICPVASFHALFSNRTLENIEVALLDTTSIAATIEGTSQFPAQGVVKIYETPKNSHISRYVFFADVAEDGMDGDAHACIVWDRVDESVAAIIHMRGHRKIYVREILALAEKFRVFDWKEDKYIHPIVNWERNAGGALHLVEEFDQYPAKFLQRKAETLNENSVRKHQYGWFTSGKTREYMINELKDLNSHFFAHPEKMKSKEIFEEAKVFVWREDRRRYEAESGKHDDLMMALSGAKITDKLLPPPVALPDRPTDDIAKQINKYDELIRQKTREQRRRTSRNGWDKSRLK